MNKLTRMLLVTGSALTAGTILAASTLEDLEIFKSGNLTQGLWRVELLDSNEPLLNQGASALGKMSICADVASQIAKKSELDEQSCKPSVLRNTRDAAEVSMTCTDGTRSHVKIDRETDRTYVLDSSLTSSDGKTRNIKARYSYEGACKGDSMIQFDKDSPACKSLANVDPAKITAMCANAPEQYRAQCEAQAKQMGNICQ